MMTQAVIALGSNIEPRKNIELARERIRSTHRVIRESRFVETSPIGYVDQPNFLNGAILIETETSQKELVEWLHQVENSLGRVRTGNRFGPRTIDLDLVMWDGEVLDTDVYEREYLREAVGEVCGSDLDV
jgi:2-amino-4-hydroxy-6-hydroxymethyldihydropteridine diphosphokinase